MVLHYGGNYEPKFYKTVMYIIIRQLSVTTRHQNENTDIFQWNATERWLSAILQVRDKRSPFVHFLFLCWKT